MWLIKSSIKKVLIKNSYIFCFSCNQWCIVCVVINFDGFVILWNANVQELVNINAIAYNIRWLHRIHALCVSTHGAWELRINYVREVFPVETLPRRLVLCCKLLVINSQNFAYRYESIKEKKRRFLGKISFIYTNKLFKHVFILHGCRQPTR